MQIIRSKQGTLVVYSFKTPTIRLLGLRNEPYIIMGIEQISHVPILKLTIRRNCLAAEAEATCSAGSIAS